MNMFSDFSVPSRLLRHNPCIHVHEFKHVLHSFERCTVPLTGMAVSHSEHVFTAHIGIQNMSKSVIGCKTKPLKIMHMLVSIL